MSENMELTVEMLEALKATMDLVKCINSELNLLEQAVGEQSRILSDLTYHLKACIGPRRLRCDGNG